jgi:hypothetical protein
MQLRSRFVSQSGARGLISKYQRTALWSPSPECGFLQHIRKTGSFCIKEVKEIKLDRFSAL